MPNIRNAKGSKYAYKPDVGVKTDFETILQKFAQTGTVRYSAFAQIWKEMKMHLYCAGRQNQREAREFMEDCFRIAVQFCVPPSSFLVRAGGIYLLYGLYHFQIVNPKVKIRVTPHHWKTMLAFLEEARDQQHLDLDYIFQSMVIDKVFSFTATVGWNYPSAKETEDVSVISESLKESCNAVEEIFSNSGLSQLGLIHDQYHKMKVVLNGAESTKPDTSLDIIHQDLIQGIYKTLKVHRDRQASIIQGVPYAKHKAGGGMDIDERMDAVDEDSKMSLQKGLKKKAFRTFKGYKVRGSDSDQADLGHKDNVHKHEQQWKRYKHGRQIQGRSAHINLFDKDEIDTTLDEPEIMKAVLTIPNEDIVVFKSTDSSGSEKEEESEKGKTPVKGNARKKYSKKRSTEMDKTLGSETDEVRQQQNQKDNNGSEANKSMNRPHRIEIDLRSDSDMSENRSPVKKRRSTRVKEVVSEPDFGDNDDTDNDNDEDEQMEQNVPNKRTKIKQEVVMEYDLASPEKEQKSSKNSKKQSKKKRKLLKETKDKELIESDSADENAVKEPTAQEKLHQKLAQRAKQSRQSKGKKK